MQTDNRHAAGIRHGSAIKNVPPIGLTVVAGHVDEARPRRVEAECVQAISIQHVCRLAWCGHQTISVALVLRPDPMPRHSTRSPGLILSCTLASVIGTAAGPTLPYFG